MMSSDRPRDAMVEERLEALLSDCHDALVRGEDPTRLLEELRPLAAETRQQFTETLDCLRIVQEFLPGQSISAMHPRRFGKFQLLSLLGRGGFGLVWLAEDLGLRRRVALKVPRLHTLAEPALVERFLREARTASSLEHVNLTPVFEIGQIEGLVYLATAYCEGPSLADWLHNQNAPVPVDAAAQLVEDLAGAVAYMHGRGVWHRDLKPSNVLLFPLPCRAAGTGARDESSGMRALADYQPRITDFGLARQQDVIGELTRTGMVLGTPAYMAPEQAWGKNAAAGPAADIYALGVILYELLTGRPPFCGASDLDTLRAVKDNEPAPPRRLRPDTPRDLETICLKCLEKDPHKRYGSAQALMDDLGRFRDRRPIKARPAPWWERAAKGMQRRPELTALWSVLILAALAALIGAWMYIGQLEEVVAGHQREKQQAAEVEKLAEERRGLLQQQQYVVGILRAAELWHGGRSSLMWDVLNTHIPEPGQADVRAFEWHYLHHQGRGLVDLRERQTRADALAFRPADGCFLTAGVDSSIKLRDGRWGQWLSDATFDHPGPVNIVYVSADGNWLVTFTVKSGTDEVKLWNSRTGTLVDQRQWPKAQDVCVAIHPRGHSIAIGGVDAQGTCTVRLWEPANRQERVLWQKKEHSHLTALLYSPDGATLAAAGAPSSARRLTIQLLDVATGAEKELFHGHTGWIFALAFSADGGMLVSGSRDQTVRVWDRRTGQERLKLLGFEQDVTCLAVSPDGKKIAAGAKTVPGKGRAVAACWDISAPEPRLETQQCGSGVLSLAFSADSKTLAMGGRDPMLRWWHPGEDVQHHQSLPGHAPAEAWALAFTPDGKMLASAGDDHMIRLWDHAAAQLHGELTGHTSLITALACTPDGKSLISGSFDKSLRFWDLATGKVIRSLSHHHAPIRCVATSADGRFVASASDDGTVNLYDACGKLRFTLPESMPTSRFRALEFSHDGEFLLTGGFDHAIRWWSTATGICTQTVAENDVVACLRRSTNGRLLAVGTGDGLVELRHAETGKLAIRLQGHLRGIKAVAFTPDGKTLASGDFDGAVRLWHVDSGQELISFKEQTCQINALAFSPDNRTLAAALHDGTIRLWHAPRIDSESDEEALRQKR